MNVISHPGAAPPLALAIYVALFSTYMACVVAGAWLSRLAERRRTLATGHPSVVVLVPAHNEEQGIASTVAQILRADYASGRILVVVIADNCADGTVTAATRAGARILERSDLVNRGKGQALGWALREHQALTVWVDAGAAERERRLRARSDWPLYAPHRAAWRSREEALAAQEGLPEAADVVVRWDADGSLDMRTSPRG